MYGSALRVDESNLADVIFPEQESKDLFAIRRPCCGLDEPSLFVAEEHARRSAINRRRWNELNAAGLLAAAGRAAAPTGNTSAPKPSIPELPAYVAKAFKTNLKAWQCFQALAPTYRRHFVVWIHTAKRAETRERRIRESIELLAAGKKLGLK